MLEVKTYCVGYAIVHVNRCTDGCYIPDDFIYEKNAVSKKMFLISLSATISSIQPGFIERVTASYILIMIYLWNYGKLTFWPRIWSLLDDLIYIRVVYIRYETLMLTVSYTSFIKNVFDEKQTKPD